MKVIGIITLTIVTVVLSTLWRGYVFSKLWLWFIVATFSACPLSIAQSIGLSSVVSFLTYQYDSYDDKSKSSAEKIGTGVAIALLMPALALFFGWVVKGYLPTV